MKFILLSLIITSVFAKQIFIKNNEYTCFNTTTVQDGKTFSVPKKDSIKKPFIFTIIDKKIITREKVEFNFMMKKEQMSSYSNKDYMLLLTKNLELGLVPKEARGRTQFYFKCN